ncbi:MAG: hypothetical protein WBQ65_19955 [Bryobacteraceae bacterium]
MSIGNNIGYLDDNDDNLSLTTEVNKPTMLKKTVIGMQALSQDCLQERSQGSGPAAVYKGGEYDADSSL